MKKILICAALWIALTCGAAAAPSTNGSTGLIDVPTADALREGQFSIGYFHLDEKNVIAVGTNLAKDLELSVAVAELAPGRETYVNLKYAVRQESVFLPGIAIGVEDIGGEEDRSAYLVASKLLPFGFRIHAGAGGGRYGGLFYGIEKNLTPLAKGGVFPDTSLIVEHDGHAMNYALRVSLAKGLKVDAGWRDKDPFVGVVYNLY